MIKNFEFENYKAFKKGSINIKPITIFIGGNSSGKSSVTHLPLLFYQTLNNRLANRIQEHRKSLFDINGSVIQMGNTISLIKNKDINNILSFKFSFKNADFSRKINKIVDGFHESIWETVRFYSLFLSQNNTVNRIKDTDFDLNKYTMIKNHNKWKTRDKKEFRNQLISSLKKIKETVDKLEKEEKKYDLDFLFLKRYSNNSGKVFVNRDELNNHRLKPVGCVLRTESPDTGQRPV